MDNERRTQELLEANNNLVEINRMLKAQLRKDAEKFDFYAHEHREKAAKAPTSDAALASMKKAETNQEMVNDIADVLMACSPR